MMTSKQKKYSDAVDAFNKRHFPNSQMMLCVFWSPADGGNSGTRFGEVSMHVGDMLDPPLTNDEMQQIAFAAKMEFARVCQRRKKSAAKRRGINID